MVIFKGMEPQTDCKKCPFVATDGADALLRPRMMCMALWAAKHEVKHCIKGEILDDCPLVEIVTCKDCKHNDEDTCYIDGLGVRDDYFCSSAERNE